MYTPSESATASVGNALQIFFDFVDTRKKLDEALPPRVREAFKQIIAYYTPRLSSALRLDPGDRLYCPEFLYNYGWTQLWRFGRNIRRNRTVAGVFVWLKRTLCRRQSEILKFYALERKLMFCLDACIKDDDGFANHAGDFLDAELQNPQVDRMAEARYRFNLLYAYYQTALARLGERRQQIIRLSKLHAMFRHYHQELDFEAAAPDDDLACENEDYASLMEIKEIMGFHSLNAVKAYKRRALKALVSELSRLFKKDINRADGDLARREILEEWLERYCESRHAGRLKKNPIHQAVVLCLLAVFFACG
jgi:hypothetical protein